MSQSQPQTVAQATPNLNRHENRVEVWLEEALQRFDEPLLRKVRDELTKGPEAPLDRSAEDSIERSEIRPPDVPADQQRSWYEKNPTRLVIEVGILRRLLHSVVGERHLLYRTPDKRLGATGLLRIADGIAVKIDLVFPAEYPDSPPSVSLDGPGVRSQAHRLQPDGSIPLYPTLEDWQPTHNSGTAILAALEWARRVFSFRPSPVTPTTTHRLGGPQ